MNTVRVYGKQIPKREERAVSGGACFGVGRNSVIDEFNGDFLQWLRGFYYVAKTGSISRASARMNRSQSSVSYSLQCLERQLNVMLFKRRNNLLEITPEGVQLLDWAVSAFELLEELKDALACASGELSGSVGVAGSMTILKQERVSNLVMEFMEQHPKVQVALRVGPPREALESVEYGVADFALLALARRPEKFQAVRLGAVPFILVTPKKHDFKLDRVPTREQLCGLPFVTYMGDDGAEIHTPFLAEEKLDGLTGRTVLKVNQYDLVLEYIARGAGCAIMDMLSLKMLPGYTKKTSFYPLGHFLDDLEYFMVSRKRHGLTPAASALAQRLRALFQREEAGLNLFTDTTRPARRP